MASLSIAIVLAAHLLAMNVASAGPLLGIWVGKHSAESHPLQSLVGRRLAWLSVWAFMFGMLTGGVLYWGASPGLVAAIERLPSRALQFAAWELLFSLGCLLIYAYYWHALTKRHWCRALLALVSSSNLLYHFPPLMTVLGKLAADPTWATAPTLDRAALLPLMARGEVLALTAHFALASLAVSAVTVLWLVSHAEEQQWEQDARPLYRRAAWTTLVVTLLQVPVGVWLLTTLSRTEQSALMGSSVLASLAFLGSLLLTFLLLQRLLAIAISNVEKSDLRNTAWLLIALVLLMTVTLQSSRPQEATGLQKTTATKKQP